MSAIKKFPLLIAAMFSASAWASVEITGFSVSEAAGTGTWNVTASVDGAVDSPAGGFDYQVDYETRDGTAQDENGDDDYKSKSGTLDFSANATQQITVTIVQDGKIEGDEHFFVDLYEVPPEVPKVEAPAQIAPIATGTGNIIDDDIELLVNVVFEGGGGGPVDISLDCSGNGTIDDATKTTAGGSATFEVINYVDPLDCTAVPTSAPSGTSLTSSDCNPGMDEADTECVMVFAPTRTTFLVTKEFTDGDNPTDVEVTINCFTGLPITQSQEIDETQSVEFIVTDFDDGELDCEITEEDLFGYTPTYNAGGPGTYNNDGGCNFENVAGGSENTCHIVNDADYVDVEIEKVWVIEGSVGDEVDTGYKLTLYCTAPIENADHCYGANNPAGNGNGSYDYCKKFYGNDSDVFIAEVQPEYPSSHCWVNERVYDSAVEIDNDCGDLVISAGTGDSCVITNTVFFEGIPTLSQYGMAILALLMLGVGLVGFRRFA